MMRKLVRDRVPDIIRKSGREPDVEKATGEWLGLALKDKLVEEACELRQSEDVYEELADVLEVVDAIIEYHGVDRPRLEKAKKDKLESAGGFRQGYVLRDNGEKHLAKGG
jgi:predicted house-cleaning noncanonical NTP pyrophosphatase (MazG superfamily)